MIKTRTAREQVFLGIQQLLAEIADHRQRWVGEVLTWQSKLSNEGKLMNDHPHAPELHVLRDELARLLDSLRSLKLPGA